MSQLGMRGSCLSSSDLGCGVWSYCLRVMLKGFPVHWDSTYVSSDSGTEFRSLLAEWSLLGMGHSLLEWIYLFPIGQQRKPLRLYTICSCLYFKLSFLKESSTTSFCCSLCQDLCTLILYMQVGDNNIINKVEIGLWSVVWIHPSNPLPHSYPSFKLQRPLVQVRE